MSNSKFKNTLITNSKIEFDDIQKFARLESKMNSREKDAKTNRTRYSDKLLRFSFWQLSYHLGISTYTSGSTAKANYKVRRSVLELARDFSWWRDLYGGLNGAKKLLTVRGTEEYANGYNDDNNYLKIKSSVSRSKIVRYLKAVLSLAALHQLS